MNAYPLVVNLLAAPGSGKSTTAAGVFYNLKSRGVNAELAGEYAKDLTWAKRFHTLQDQIYVFGKQHHRLFRLADECSVIICDSPLILNLAYAEDYPDCFKQTVKWAFDQYNNMNFLVRRTKPYMQKGRKQTEAESDQKQLQIMNLLYDYKIPYDIVDGDQSGVDFITKEIIENFPFL